jgi:hypothetical protein
MQMHTILVHARLVAKGIGTNNRHVRLQAKKQQQQQQQQRQWVRCDADAHCPGACLTQWLKALAPMIAMCGCMQKHSSSANECGSMQMHIVLAHA